MISTGELAALGTAACWAFTSIFFSEAGRLIGSYNVNKIRLVMAVVIYSLLLLLTTGHFLSDAWRLEHFIWLGVSGIIGLVIGDGAGFKALVMIGPRLTSLLLSSAPVIATILAWLFLEETLTLIDLCGMGLTLGGIMWVVAERRYQQNNHNSLHAGHPDVGSLAKGVGLGFVAAFGQGAGLVIAKHAMLGLGTTLPPVEASFIRMLVAMATIWVFSLVRGTTKETIQKGKNRRAMLFALGGAVFGPFMGVWLSLIAVSKIAAGIAATLNATTPVMILPLVRVVYRERINLRILAGTLIAVFGVVVLMLY